MRKYRLWFLPFWSAIILALGLEGVNTGWLSLVGLLPLLFFLQRAKSRKSIFWGSWSAGFLFFAINLRWFLAAFPADWAGAYSSKINLIGLVMVWLGSAAVLGLSFAFFGLVFRCFQPKSFKSLAFVPLIWITGEYLRAWLFSFWSLGPESLLGPHWTFGHLGYSLASTPAFILARYLGLYGLSFLVVAINAVIFWLLAPLDMKLSNGVNKSKNWPDFCGRVAIFLAGFILIFFMVPRLIPSWPSEKIIRVDLLQTNPPPFLYYQGLIELLEENSLPANDELLPHLVVFPEGSGFFSIMSPETEPILPKLFTEKEQGLIISSTLLAEGDLRFEKVIYRDKDGQLLAAQSKSFLIPTGEYLPYLLEAAFKIFGSGQYIGTFQGLRHISRAPTFEKPVSFADTRVGTLLCSGIVSPNLYRHLTRDGAEILVNSASQSIIGSSAQALFQIETLSRFQAIANGRPFLQAANGGHAFAIDADGKFIARSLSLANSFVSSQVQAGGKETLASQLGDWPILVVIILVLMRLFAFGFNCLRARFRL